MTDKEIVCMTIRLPVDLYRCLRKMAENDGRSLQREMIHALKLFSQHRTEPRYWLPIDCRESP